VFRFPAALFTAALISGLVAIVSLGTGINEWGGFATVSAWAFCALSAAASRRFKSLTFTLWVLAFGASAWFFPWIYTWSLHGWEPKHAILPLVQVIMFGMGVTLTFEDFGRVLKMPRAVLIGVVCQYIVMPLMAWTFAAAFGLPNEVAAGLILIGSSIRKTPITYTWPSSTLTTRGGSAPTWQARFSLGRPITVEASSSSVGSARLATYAIQAVGPRSNRPSSTWAIARS
jgi:hypothetical protein